MKPGIENHIEELDQEIERLKNTFFANKSIMLPGPSVVKNIVFIQHSGNQNGMTRVSADDKERIRQLKRARNNARMRVLHGRDCQSDVELRELGYSDPNIEAYKEEYNKYYLGPDIQLLRKAETQGYSAAASSQLYRDIKDVKERKELTDDKAEAFWKGYNSHLNNKNGQLIELAMRGGTATSHEENEPATRSDYTLNEILLKKAIKAGTYAARKDYKLPTTDVLMKRNNYTEEQARVYINAFNGQRKLMVETNTTTTSTSNKERKRTSRKVTKPLIISFVSMTPSDIEAKSTHRPLHLPLIGEMANSSIPDARVGRLKNKS